MTRGDLSKKHHRYVRKCLLVATWNVRTLVENAGDERIRRKRPQEALSNPQAVEWKLDLILKRYRVSVGAIQETKWFGNDVW